jgi:IS30 family transposase
MAFAASAGGNAYFDGTRGGTNENTNRLLRQYLHKNADLGSFTQDHLNAVAAKLNHRPRRVLGWSTPAEAFDGVQQTA